MWKMEYFGLKLGQDLGNRAAHPYQEFRGVPPPPPPGNKTLLNLLSVTEQVKLKKPYAHLSWSWAKTTFVLTLMYNSVMPQANSEKNSECSYQESNLRPSDY